MARTSRIRKRRKSWWERPLVIFVWLLALFVVIVAFWIYFVPHDTQPVAKPPPRSLVHELQGLSIPIADHWETMGNEEFLAVHDTTCPNEYGKGCSVLTVVVKTNSSDPDDFLRAYKDSCEKKAVRHGDRKIGSRAARYYVIDPCVSKSNTSSDEVRSLWYIPGVVAVLETHGLGQKRMTGVDEVLAGATWQR